MLNKSWLIAAGTGAAAVAITTCSLAKYAANVIQRMGDKGIQNKIDNYIALAAKAPRRATVFLGDSITEFCPVNEIYREYTERTGIPVLNRGIGSERSDSMLQRIEQTILPLEPANLIMLMGINDFFQNRPQEQIAENIRQIIRRVHESIPETRILLQAVYPVNTHDRNMLIERIQMHGRDNGDIRKLNQLIAQVAREENIEFIDLTEVLSDNEGQLRHEYSYDGLHPNMNGYLVIRDHIEAALKRK